MQKRVKLCFISNPSNKISSNFGQETRLAFAEAKQGQVFRFWDKLNQVEREALVNQANQIDLLELREGLHQALNSDLSKAQLPT